MKKIFVVILIALGLGSYLFIKQYKNKEVKSTTDITKTEEVENNTENNTENKIENEKDTEIKTLISNTNVEKNINSKDFENKVNIIKKNLGITANEKTVKIMLEIDEMLNLTDAESNEFFDKLSLRLSKIVKSGYANVEKLNEIVDLTKVILVKEKEYKVKDEKLTLDDLERAKNSAFNILGLNQDALDKKEIIKKNLDIKIDKNTVEIMVEIDKIANLTDYESKALFNKVGAETAKLVKDGKAKPTDLKKILELIKLVLSNQKNGTGENGRLTANDANKALMDVIKTFKK
ncbi:hypothetical protein [Oceanivirga salmonicida]|uniref:hypothetical protein n=1 Tax=Oceanivirga salmonicida TaxID=1769291 RepID=UPI0008350C9D|nr:hypothetical protein [Oceanivirga salmonicida]